MNTKTCFHGVAKAQGCSHLRLGNFSKLFPALAGLPVSEAEAAALGGPDGIMHDLSDSSPDSGIPSAYTFFAQFVDHDITLDVTTMLHGSPRTTAEIEKLPNLRSPSLDLDSVYAFGPEATPFLYDPDAPGRLLTGNAANPSDLPRNNEGRALIGDPRNDENLFISQMHLLFLRLHNRILDSLVGSTPAEHRFGAAQRETRYHYQYIVLHDFLRRVCDPKIYQFALTKLAAHKYPLIYKPDAHGNLPMPVEFSVAAYRFGHTMVRSAYPANGQYPNVELFDEAFGTLGFSPVPTKLTVDWRYQLDVDDCISHLESKAIDHLLADELIRLPNPVVGKSASANDRSLAFRNLLRGNVLALPSGQAVATALKAAGYPINPAQNLKFNTLPGWANLPAAMRTKLEKKTPLFFYMMREGGVIGGGNHLGPVASAVLLEVFIGALVNCKSFLSEPKWKPLACIAGKNKLTLADVVRYVNAH